MANNFLDDIVSLALAKRGLTGTALGHLLVFSGKSQADITAPHDKRFVDTHGARHEYFGMNSRRAGL